VSDDRWFMKEPCKHCPFRRDVTPFLTPERADEISGLTWNRYNEFPCHKTIDFDDEGDSFATAESLTCAGFLAMQISESGMECPDGFEPSDKVYSDPYEMTGAYQDEWDKSHARVGAP
jgi:hypothetical protein